MSSMLVGESALPEQEEAILAAVAATPGITRLISMRTVHTGPDELLVAVKIGAAGSATTAELANAINDAERRIRSAVPGARYISLEPDLYQERYQSAHGESHEDGH